MKHLSYIVPLFIAGYALAQTTWTGGGDGALWGDASNWSNGVPSSTTGAVFNTATIETGFDSDITVASLTFNTGVASGDKIVSVGGSVLAINGALTNNTAVEIYFDTPVNAGGNATWDGPLNFGNIVNISTRSITTAGSLTFTGTNLNFDITNTTTYGRFLGLGTTNVAGVTINIGGAYTGGTLGDTFDFTTSNFASASIGSLPTLSDGLSWNTSQFLSQGILTVVSAIPEPSTFATLAGIAAVGFIATRRRSRS